MILKGVDEIVKMNRKPKMVEAKVETKLLACTIEGDNYKEVIQVSYHPLCVLFSATRPY